MKSSKVSITTESVARCSNKYDCLLSELIDVLLSFLTKTSHFLFMLDEFLMGLGELLLCKK